MTNGIVLGVDLDGVCLDYTGEFRNFTAKVLGVDPKDIADPSSYSFFESGWGFTSEDHFKLVHGQAVDDGLYTRLPTMPGVSETLHRLSDKGYHIRIITNRFVNKGQHGKVVAQTAERLETANIPYRDLCFVKDKTEINADLYLDDAPFNIEALRAVGREAVVFTAPYNHHMDGPRVDNWEQVEQYLFERFGF